MRGQWQQCPSGTGRVALSPSGVLWAHKLWNKQVPWAPTLWAPGAGICLTVYPLLPCLVSYFLEFSLQYFLCFELTQILSFVSCFAGAVIFIRDSKYFVYCKLLCSNSCGYTMKQRSPSGACFHTHPFICALLPIFSTRLQHVTLAWCHTKPADLSLKALSSIDDCLYFLPAWNCFILTNPVIKTVLPLKQVGFTAPPFPSAITRRCQYRGGYSLAWMRLGSAASSHKCAPPATPRMGGSPVLGSPWRPWIWIIFVVRLFRDLCKKDAEREHCLKMADKKLFVQLQLNLSRVMSGFSYHVKWCRSSGPLDCSAAFDCLEVIE